MMHVQRLTSVAYIGPKSRTERPRKTKIGTEVAHVTRDSDTNFKVKRSRGGAHCGGLPHSLLLFLIIIQSNTLKSLQLHLHCNTQKKYFFSQKTIVSYRHDCA